MEQCKRGVDSDPRSNEAAHTTSKRDNVKSMIGDVRTEIDNVTNIYPTK
jgi:hypothetical protein